MQIRQNIPLSDLSSYKIGGQAKFFAKVEDLDGLTDVLKQWNKISEELLQKEKKILILGGGTNILFEDKGFDGLVILNSIKGITTNNSQSATNNLKTVSSQKSEISSQKLEVTVGSGVLMEDLLNFCVQNSLSGLEWAGGLPGTLGGAIRGNAGAFRGEIKDVIYDVTSLNLCSDVLIHHYNSTSVKKRKNSDCRFGYRTSIFKDVRKDEIILEAVLKLKKGQRVDIEKKINEKINYRRQKHPVEYPNLGSTFKNIPAEELPASVREEFKDKIKDDPFPILPSVKLIAGAGMTNVRVGNIEVSGKHPNYLVNIGNGKSEDVLALIYKIKSAVRQKYRVELEEEITIVKC